jgi:hypothetical protein
MAGRSSRALAMLENMGFGREPARAALKQCHGDVQRAVDMLTDSAEQLPAPSKDESALQALDDLLQQASPPEEEDDEEDEELDDGDEAEDSPAAETGAQSCMQAGTEDEDEQELSHQRLKDDSDEQRGVQQPARKRRARDPAGPGRGRPGGTAGVQPTGRVVAPADAAPAASWQWLAKAGWQAYDAAVCQHLETSFACGMERTQVQLGSASPVTYVVDFDQMVQFPERWEGRRRKVRRTPAAAPASAPSRKPRQRRERLTLVSSDDDDDNDFDAEPSRPHKEDGTSDEDFDAKPARPRKEDAGSRSASSHGSRGGTRSKPEAKRKTKQRKADSSAEAKSTQPSLAGFLKMTHENRAARGPVKRVSSQRTNNQPAALRSDVDEDEDEIVDDIEPSRSRPAALRPAVATASSELWTDKYAPRDIETLAVHKTGVDRVRGWLRESLRALSAPQQSARSSALSVLVLKGPPGSGKTTLIRLLAAELQCAVREWTSPVGNSSWGSEERLGPGEWRDQHRVPYEGGLDPLEHFLLGTAKYGMLPGVAVAGAASMPSTAKPVAMSSAQQIILVDELPQLNKLEHRERFHALIRTLAERTRSPAVFIISSHRTGSSGGSMGDATTTSAYFPESLLSHPQLTEQKLLEVNKTSLEKTLRAINLAESGAAAATNSRRGAKGVALATIKAIAASCHGDVRAAVHSLQFESVGGGANAGGASGRSKPKRKATGTTNVASGGTDDSSNNSSLVLGSRDVRLDMFRALGRILYNKRLNPNDEKSISAADAARHAAIESTVRAELRRPPSKDHAESIVDGYDVDWPRLCEQLQQNYLGFFTQVEEAETAAVGLSDGALIGGWQDDKPAREFACSLAASATVRAIRWANTAPSEATFRPFHYKSTFSHDEEQAANWRGADKFLASTGVVGSGETSVRSRQTRFELANYVQFMQNNGGLPAPSHAATAVAAGAAELEEIDEIE